MYMNPVTCISLAMGPKGSGKKVSVLLKDPEEGTLQIWSNLSKCKRYENAFPTRLHVCTVKTQISLHIYAGCKSLCCPPKDTESLTTL